MLTACRSSTFPAAAKTRNPSRRDGRVALILAPEATQGFRFFGVREVHIHRHQEGEHQQGEQGWPLQEETEHDDDEPDILRVPHIAL